LAACDALAKALDYLPLALEQAAAYMAAPGAGVGFAGYLRLYEAAAAELLARKALGSTEYPDAVITTWQATVAKLSPESRAVLRLCAWYADTPIPRALVMGGATEVLALAAGFGPVLPLSGPAAAELRMRDALTGLARYSMILDATDATFRVHGLVQTVERVRAEQEGRDDEARDRALVRLTAIFPYAYDEPSAWPLCRQLLPHHRTLVARLGTDHESAELPRLLNKAGLFLLGSGDAAGALPLFRRALESRERLLGPEHPDTLTSVNNLAHCLNALGDAAGALPLYRRALESKERVLGPEHPNTLSGVSNLAVCMWALGDAAGALPLCRRALESSERVLGPEHPDTLTSVNNLAVCMWALGDAAGALPLYRRALESRERLLGAEHPDTLSSVGALAGCLDSLGHLDEAGALHRREIDGLERRLGADHPDVLSACNNLAHSFRAAGRPDLALPLARRVAEISERVLAGDPPRLLFRRGNLALTLLMTGETREGRRLLAGCWAWPAPDCANTTPGIAFLGLLADLLDGGNGAGAIGRLKPLLLGPKLPVAAGVAYPWDVGYLLDYLAPRLPDGDRAFLTALLAAINDPDLAPALDRFPIWRDTEAVPRDAPWPVTEIVAGGQQDGPDKKR